MGSAVDDGACTKLYGSTTNFDDEHNALVVSRVVVGPTIHNKKLCEALLRNIIGNMRSFRVGRAGHPKTAGFLARHC